MADKTIILSKDPSQLCQEIPLIEGDNNTYVIRFVAPRYSGGVDLANLTWGVNIKNATLEQGFVNLSSATSDDSAVYIDWNVGSFATALHGSSFCTIEGRNNSSSAHPVWKSSVVTLRVGRAISADDIIDGSDIDSITEIAENVAESIVNNSVRYDTSQSLNSTQKTTARTNIGAVSQDEVQQAVATETSAREAAVAAEATAREAADNELKSAFVNYVADVVFNGAGWEQGSVNGLNGEDLESNTVSRTGFLQVTPEKTYTISHNDLNGYILYEFTYNSNGAYIGHLNITAYNGRRYETNVAFVRFRLEKANSTVTPEIAKGFNIRIYKNDGELFNAIDKMVLQADANNPTRNRSQEIRDRLNSEGYCKLGPGTFYASNIELPEGSTVEGCGMSTILVLNEGDLNFMFKLGQRTSIHDIRIDGGEYTISENINYRRGICWYTNANDDPTSARKYAKISNVYISNVDNGIFCQNSGGNPAHGLLVSDCTIENCGIGVFVSYYSEFSKFVNVRCNACYFGSKNYGGNNIFSNCDFSGNVIGVRLGESGNNYRNNSHGSYIGCTIHHNGQNPYDLVNYGYAIQLYNMFNGEMFEGCHIGYGKVLINGSKGVCFTGCNFITQDFEVENGSVLSLQNNVFTQEPNITKTADSTIIQNDNILRLTAAEITSEQKQKLGVMQNFPTDSPATSANAPYNDLDTLPVTSVVVYGLMNGVQHLPDGVTSATIITTNSDNSMSNGAVQLLIDRNNGGILYSRIRAANQWTQWKRALTKSNGVIEFFGNYMYPGGTLSLANAPENATVYVTGDTTYTDKPSFVDSFEGFLTTVVKAVAPQQKYQYFVGRDNGFICYRTYILSSASWGDWIKVLNQYSLLSATGQNTSVGMTQKAITDAINGAIDNTLVNDKVLDATVNIDNISGNHIGYVLNGRNPGELPIDKAVGWLFTFSTVSVRTQIFYTMYQGNTTYTGGTYMRYYNGTSWGPWRRTDSRKYHCGIASFIDDDTSSEEQVQQYASIFREYGLKCGFACVPMPSATHPEYGYIQDNSFQKTMLRLQDDGFSCLLHCYHQSATQPEYILLDEQPADWESAFDKYFKIVGGQYKQLLATESFSANTYYRANTEFYSEAYRGKFVLLTEKPIDWEWNRYEYYTRTYNLVTSENAPLHWGEATYYQNYYTKSGDIYTQLTSWPVDGYTANTYYTAAHSVVSTYPMPEFEQNIYYTPVCWNPYIVQNNMGLTIRTMQKIGLNGWKYWVIPYGETPRDLRRIAKDHGIECAWIMGGTYSDANLKTDRYRINRYTLNAADAVSDYLSGTPTKLNAVKAMIDTVAQNNGWICFCTHINTWRDSRYIGTQVTADQGFNLTKQFVKAVIEYCLEKGVPVESPIRAYEERKDMFDPMESL